MAKCVQPNASWVRCCICQNRIKTCERKKPVGKLNDYTCPAHGKGCQLHNGKWVCSFKHWEAAIKKYYGHTV